MATIGDAEPRRRGRPRNAPGPSGEADPHEGIVAAASALFAARGVEGVTMAQIAEHAGLKQSSIYYWFRSKSDILASILGRVNRVPLEIVERERAAEGPMAVRLLRLVRQDVLALCSFPFDINEIHRLARRNPEDFVAYWQERDRLDDEVEALIIEGVGNGELRAVDARLAARTLLAGDEATQNWFRSPRGATYAASAVAEHVAEVALRSLLADPSRFDDVANRAAERS